MPLLTRFKWGVILFLSGLAIGPLFSQSTTVSVTVVDQGGQVWTNGTISYVFQGNGSFGGKYQWNGANLPAQYLVPQIVSLNGSGFATFSVPSSTAITPSGSSWRYVVCPNASAINCPIINIPAVGATQNISSTVTANAPAISMNPTPMPLAYSDTEVQTVPNQGGIYFNTTSLVPKYWDGTTWHVFGSGGGGGSPANPNLSIQYNNNGAFGALPCLTDSVGGIISCAFGNTLGSNGTYISSGNGCVRSTLPGLTAGTNIADAYCIFVSGIDTYPGWSLGNSGLSSGGNGWYNTIASNIDMRYQNAGIKSAINIGFKCSGVGDCNIIDANPLFRGGTSAYSDEGTTYQLKMLEDTQTNGTVQTGGGGTGVNTLTVNKNQNTDGIGQLIIDTTDDVISTTITASTNSASYATVTVPATLPVSTVCSTVISDVPVPTQPEGTFTLETINLNTTTNLTTAAGNHALLTVVLPYIETNKLVSAGTFTGTTQTVTALLNKSIAAGSPYCVGGMSGRGMEQVPFTISGQKYIMRVVGSPTNHTMEVTYMTAQGPKPDFVAARSPLPMAIKLYHSATIIGGVGTSNSFTITDNDALWTDAATWISPNFVTNTVVYNIQEQYYNPYIIDLGFAHAISGLSLLQVDSFSSKNQNADGNYLSYGGIYGTPIAMHIYGQHGAGELWENVPENLFWSGNFFRGAAISMGTIPGGTSTVDWNIADYRTNDDRFFYTPSTQIWAMIGAGGLTINGNQVCTPANGFCTGAGTVTHVSGPLNLNKFVLGNVGNDVKVDTTAGTDGVGNGVFASITTGAGSSACGTATSCFAALEASTAGTPATGNDYFRASSTTHQWLVSLNNSAEFVSLMNFSTINLAIGTAGGVTGLLAHANIATTAVTPGSYTNANITVAADGTITAAANGSGGSSPLTTKGDLFGFSTLGARIPVGADTFVLTADSTQALGVKWAAATSGFTNPMTTAGDLILATAGGTASRLAIGSNTFVLTSNGTTASWQAAAGAAPCGSTTQLQFNNAGSCGASANLAWDITNARLLIGAPTSTSAISLAAGTTAPFGINFGDATANLYRSAAGIIKSDGELFAVNLVATFTSSRTYGTSTNCSSTASPAACSNSTSGQVQVAAAATTLTVNSTSVTSNSRIFLTYSVVGITGPTNVASLIPPYVSAIVNATSFTITLPVAPLTNPVNIMYEFFN